MRLAIVIIILLLAITDVGAQRKKAMRYFERTMHYVTYFKGKTNGFDTTLVRGLIGDLSMAIKYDKKFWQAYRNRARYYDHMGMYDSAISDIGKAVEIVDSAERYYMYMMRGDYYFKTDQFDKALTDYTLAWETSKIDSYLYQRAKTYHRLGKEELACIDFKTACAASPNLVVYEKEFPGCR